MRQPIYQSRPERWPRLSLKGFFALVTVACVLFGWLGWQVRIVQHRKAIIRQLVDDYGTINPLDYDGPQKVEVRRPIPGSRVSEIRKLLGDQQVQVLMLNRPMTEADLVAFDAFPEASILAVGDGTAAIHYQR